MARSYANIMTSIWDDEDFCALSAGAQRTYFMLVTQPDINACGTLALTLRRWSLTLPPRERKNLAKWLDELAATTFIVMDERTEELLVRTFVKHDGGYKNPKRLAAIWATADVIRSSSVRSAFGIETTKLGLSNGNPRASEGQSNADRSPSERARVVVTEVVTDHTPHTTNLEREPSADAAAAEPSPFCSKHPTGTEEPCGPCGTANRRHRAWLAAAPERERRAKAAAAKRLAAAAACPDCAGSHWRDDGSKCNHGRTA